MRESVRSEWLEIYDCLKKIKNLKPWEKLDNLIPVILDFGGSNQIFITVMGNGGEEFGMIFYPDAYEYCKSICQYERPLKLPEAVMFNHESISVIYNDREDLTEETVQHLKDVGISFRGKRNWISIEKNGGRMMPSVPQNTDRKKLLKYLKSFLEVCKYLNKNEIENNYDFENIMLCIWYKITKQKIDMHKFERSEMFAVMNYEFDEPQIIEEINKIKQKKYCAEINLHYSAYPSEDEEENKFFSEIFCAANHKTGKEILITHNCDNIDEIDFIFSCMLQMCRENGRPAEIIVNDIYLAKTIEDFCVKTNIKLSVSEELLEKADALYCDMEADMNSFVDILSMMDFSKEDLLKFIDSPEELLQNMMNNFEFHAEVPPITVSRHHEAVNKTYIISVSLCKGCYRHISISADATFGELHEIILEAFDFDDDHMHEFYLNNQIYSRDGRLTHDEFDSSYNYILSDYLTIGQKFAFLFDYGDEWEFSCKLLKEENHICTEAAIIKSVGEAPEQYPDYDDEY